MAYQPQEVPLAQQAAAAAAAADQQAGTEVQKVRLVLSLPFDAAAVANSDEIQWVCCDSLKPVSGFGQLLCSRIVIVCAVSGCCSAKGSQARAISLLIASIRCATPAAKL
jgi:hypothetical protein